MRAAALPRALLRLISWPTRATWSALPQTARRWLIAIACACALLAGGYVLWFRDSSFVRVEQVAVSGLTSEDAPEIRSALVGAARQMTTLNFDAARLERAVARYPAVAGIEVSTGLPDRVTVQVIEKRPVATVPGADGEQVPVAEDGTLLRDFEADDSLVPLAAAAVTPETERIGDEDTLATLAAVAAVPTGLAERVEAVEHDEFGDLAATVDGGPYVVLGDDSRLDEKWGAAAAVIADGHAAEGQYLDVSLPERPAVGG